MLAAAVHEIRLFCQASRLTPRETEVVLILAEGVTKIKDIADRLHLSPNTVNNHVNSIFLKTKTRSKSQLLAILLNRVADELHWTRWLRRHPRVMMILEKPENEASLLGPVGKASEMFRSRTLAKTSDWKVELERTRPHFLVYELGANETCETVLTALGSHHDLFTIFVTSGKIEAEDRCRALGQGAVEFMSASDAPKKLFELMLSLFIDEEPERWAFLQSQARSVDHDHKIHQGLRALSHASTVRWGRGGVFVPATDLDAVFGASMKSGDWVEFSMELAGGVTGHARGQVSWIRGQDVNDLRSGAGIRIVALDPSLRSQLQGARVINSGSYIPHTV